MKTSEKEFRLYIAKHGTEWVLQQLNTYNKLIHDSFLTEEDKVSSSSIAAALKEACGNQTTASEVVRAGRKPSPTSAASLIREFFSHTDSASRSEVIAWVKARNSNVSEKSIDMVANTLREEGLTKKYGTWEWVRQSGTRRVA